MLDADVHLGMGVGRVVFPVHASIAVWGLGEVRRGGVLVASRVPIFAGALASGAFLDTREHTLASAAREGEYVLT